MFMRFIVPNEGHIVKKGEVIGFLGGLKGEPGAGNTAQMHLHFGLGIKNFDKGLFITKNQILKNVDGYDYTRNNFIDPFLDKDYGYTTPRGTYIGYIENVKNTFLWKQQAIDWSGFDSKKVSILIDKILGTSPSIYSPKKGLYINGTLLLNNPNTINDDFLKIKNVVLTYFDNMKKPCGSIFYSSYIINYYDDFKKFTRLIDVNSLAELFMLNVWGKEDEKYEIGDNNVKKRVFKRNTTLDYFKSIFGGIKNGMLDVYKLPEKDIVYGDNRVDISLMEKIGYANGDIINIYKNRVSEIYKPLRDQISEIIDHINKATKNSSDTETLTEGNEILNSSKTLIDTIIQRDQNKINPDTLFIDIFNIKFKRIKGRLVNGITLKKLKENLGFLHDFFSMPIDLTSSGKISLQMFKYVGYKNDNMRLTIQKSLPDYLALSKELQENIELIKNSFNNIKNELIDDTMLEEKPKTASPGGRTEKLIPKVPPIDDLLGDLDSRIITPNTPLEKKFVGVTTQTIPNGIMEFINMGKSGLGTGGDKAGGAGGTPSKGGSAATTKSTGKNTGITPLGKDKYNKMPEPAKPKTANANPAPKTNNLLGGKNKPGANSWQDMVKGTFGSLAAGAGIGNISGTKATAPQQGEGALAKANTTSQPYPALNSMKNAGMPSNPGAGFQTPTIPNSAMPARKTDGSMGPPAPTSIPSLASASYKPQLPNTNYIPESTPKGNTVKDKIKPDSQPGKPKVTEITIKGENADRYELMARELPSMWERYEKESAQRLI